MERDFGLEIFILLLVFVIGLGVGVLLVENSVRGKLCGGGMYEIRSGHVYCKTDSWTKTKSIE